MRILHLTLKRKWFAMVASGEKREEYREIKPYWNKRLRPFFTDEDSDKYIVFKNGYNKNSPIITVELKSITSSIGIIEWGAPENKPVYILKLGKIISK